MQRQCLGQLQSVVAAEGAVVLHGLSGVGKSRLLRDLAATSAKQHFLPAGYILSDIAIDREFRNVLCKAAEDPSADSLLKALSEYFSIPAERVTQTFFLFDGAEMLRENLGMLLAKRLPLRTAWATNRFDLIKDADANFFAVHPLTFAEFLELTGHPEYNDMIRSHQEGNHPVPELFAQEFNDLYYDYMLTGGFPQAVNAYLEDRTDISALRIVHAQIHARIVQSFTDADGRLPAKLQSLLWYYEGRYLNSQDTAENGIEVLSVPFRPGAIGRGLTRRQFEDAHRFLTDNGYLIPVRTERKQASGNNTTDVDERYAFADTGLCRYLHNDYDTFYNTEREELPYSILVQALYCECLRAGIPVSRWESSRRNMHIPLVLDDTREYFTIRCEASKRNRAANAFFSEHPDYTGYQITDSFSRNQGAHHNIQWFELEQALMSKKR